MIDRARGLVAEDQYRLDKLLNRTEQDLRDLEKKEKELHRAMKENERLKKEMEQVMNRERHQQQVQLLKKNKTVYQRKGSLT